MTQGRAAAVVAMMIAASCAQEDKNVVRNAAPPVPAVPASEAPPAAVNDNTPPPQILPAATAAAATTTSSAIDEQMVEPYFTEEPAAAAMKRFAINDWSGAAEGFRSHLSERGALLSSEDRARLELLIALCDARQEKWSAAAPSLERVADQLPRISGFIHYEAAQAYFFAQDYAKAEKHGRAVPPGTRHHADALLLVGDVLRIRGQWKAAVDHYREYVKDRQRGPRLAEAMYKLAEALEKTKRAIPEALELYRTITIAYPIDEWTPEAERRYKTLLRKLPRAKRKKYSTQTAAEMLQTGMALHDEHRNPEAAAQLAKVSRARDATNEQKCIALFHQANSWYKERQRTKSAPLFDKAIKACGRTQNIDLRVKAAYEAGRSYDRLDEAAKAIARFKLIEKYPNHSYVDDARLREAEQYLETKRIDKYLATLATIATDFPNGDMRGEAVWRLAWHAFTNKNYTDAIRWLDKGIELTPIEHHWTRAGQAQYWKGRAFAELGKTRQSAEAYRDCVRLYPLSFYSLLALNRLRESHPREFAAVRKQISTAPAGFDPDAPAFTFKDRPVYKSEHFLRALEFLRLGLSDAASFELERAGFASPPNRREVTDPDERDRLWAMAFLYDRAGVYDKSHWSTRWHIIEYQRQWPVGHNLARWRIAYPLAFLHLVEKNADKHGYNKWLQMGIMREESAFDPQRESWANAVGLTQMIPPTAKRFSRGTGIRPTRESLRDPEMNMVIGSNFLGFLWNTFNGRVGLTVPSYNAGEGATWRWILERHSPEWTWDMFAEQIPGDQARNYTKRVIGSFFAYAYLADQTIPEMPNVVPLDIVPERKRNRARKQVKRKRKRGRRSKRRGNRKRRGKRSRR